LAFAAFALPFVTFTCTGSLVFFVPVAMFASLMDPMCQSRTVQESRESADEREPFCTGIEAV
jgi:hypothetical protein